MADYLSKTDKELVLLCRKNDELAWKELYVRYFSVSRTLSYKYAGNNEPDDLIQEGLLGLLSAVHSFKDDKNVTFKTFAWTCIRNKILNEVKRLDSKRSVSSDDCLSFEKEKNLADSSMTPEEIIISKNKADSIWRVINKSLTEREQIVFKGYLEDKSYQEIASALDISVKAVDAALQRARKKLKAELDVQ